VDLVSTESCSIAEVPKHCFYYELVFKEKACFCLIKKRFTKWAFSRDLLFFSLQRVNL